jgi:HSP20 family molecular chaperone IbpA
MSSGLLAHPKEEASVQTGKPAQLIEEERNLYDRIARRAFEIFKSDGLPSHDLADWLQAETEFLHPLHIAISESTDAVSVRADVPGFKEKNLEITVEPCRVTIAGRREAKKESKTGKTIYREACSDQILRVVGLPAAVDVNKVKTTVKDGVLELDLAKAAPDKHTPAAA